VGASIVLILRPISGCGLNVLNLPPITSLVQMLIPESERQLSIERTAATIMAKFEGMWMTFLSHNGSFEPFMSLYLERWLHS
jgi:biotin---protein ligase